MSAAAKRAGGKLDLALVGAALVAGAVLLWLVTREPMVPAIYGAGVLALGVLAWTIALRRAPAVEPEFAIPDWSVTVAAMEGQAAAVAVTDRAGRLVCANARFDEWFGTTHAPPRLDVDAPSLDRLAKAARTAWRDGSTRSDLIESETGRWLGEASRAGRGDDYLIWRFAPIEVPDPLAELATRLGGPMGRALDRAGFAAALTDPDGTIRAANGGFALRATGDPDAGLAGTAFVAHLRQGANDRISWDHAGRHGGPVTLYHIPLADPDAPDGSDPAASPLLILVADNGLGIGGGGSDAAASAPHLEALISQLPLGLAMADRDGRLLFANPAFLRAAGLEGGEPPTYPTDLVVREDKGALSDAIRRFAQGPAAQGDIAIRLIGQPDEPVSLSLAGVRGLGEASVLLGLTDNTVETRLKRQVAQATKMQAVGQLAGGVAHDFNNVLTAILGTCDLMLLRHTPGDSDYDDIQQIRANSNRAASLTRQLLAFSRQQTLRPVVLQLPDVVTETSQLLKRLIGEKIRLDVRHGRDLGPVRADPTQLEQIVVNLAVNARDAMLAKGGIGTLTLTTRRVTPTDVRALRNEVIPAGDYTALIVEDTGGGIAPEHVGKIWEPFFTTKEQGRGGSMGGTGLGLSTVYGIVKQSGGFIFVDSELGKGTRFTVYLPVDHGNARDAALALQAAPQVAPAQQWAGGGRVLLVEDEDTVRLVAERALVRQGYTVTAARDGEEGLELVQEGGTFDLVVSDVVMPGMDGPAMVREIRKLAPSMPVLFMSGYAEEQLRKEIDIAQVQFLPKPFSVQQIGDAVGRVLAQKA